MRPNERGSSTGWRRLACAVPVDTEDGGLAEKNGILIDPRSALLTSEPRVTANFRAPAAAPCYWTPSQAQDDENSLVIRPWQVRCFSPGTNEIRCERMARLGG